MTWWGWLLAVTAVVLLAVVVTLALVIRRLIRSVRELATGLDGLRQQTLPLLADTRSALRKSEGVNRRADQLIDTATSITGTVDAATRLAYSVVSNPLVRVLSFFTGTRHAAKRLRSVTSPDGAIARRTQVPRQIQQARNTRRELPVSKPSTKPSIKSINKRSRKPTK